jgi:VWFA-related protein
MKPGLHRVRPFYIVDDLRRLAAAACAAILCATSPAIAQEAPVFRSDSRLVQLDVIVRNRNGFVHGLTKNQFTIEDDGQPRAIAAFTAPASQGLPEPLPSGTVSNRFNSSGQQPSGITVVFLDRLNIPVAMQPFVYYQLRQLVQNRKANDRIAIYVLDRSLSVVHDLTSDEREIERAVNALKPINVFFPTGDGAAAMLDGLRLRVAMVNESLEDIARHLSDIPGRKNLIWISTGLPRVFNYNGIFYNFTPEMTATLRKVSDLHVAVYPVDARGLVVADFMGPIDAPRGTSTIPALTRPVSMLPPNLDTFNLYADQTGGKAYYNTHGIAQSIEKGAEDGRLVYTLGFYPPEESLDGKFHKLRVRVSMPGVEVRTRSNYFAAQPGSEPQPRRTLQDHVTSALDSSEIGLIAHIEPEGEQVRLHLSADLHDLSLELKDGLHSSAVEIVVSDGVTPTVAKLSTQLSEAQVAEALSTPYGITWKILLAPATSASEIRAVVQDRATGATGSLHVPIPGR